MRLYLISVCFDTNDIDLDINIIGYYATLEDAKKFLSIEKQYQESLVGSEKYAPIEVIMPYDTSLEIRYSYKSVTYTIVEVAPLPTSICPVTNANHSIIPANGLKCSCSCCCCGLKLE